MGKISEAESWRQNLLSGQRSVSDSVDELQERRARMTDTQIAEWLMPLAELRAGQIDAMAKSTDEKTSAEAARLQGRYERHISPDTDAEAQARKAVDDVPGERSPLVGHIAKNWTAKVISGMLIGEMDKELERTVGQYKADKQEALKPQSRFSTGAAR